ncbi:MAG: virulence protein RhuM/Fic/DOC family protein [Candidatus Saganbacteria bacterium]|nr:virulence protein RhuM/Fic/DOC family protein [Candidatus Saganbacteria bacterium]
MKKKPNNKVVVYQGPSGALELKADNEHATIWATQAQLVKLYNVDQSVVSRHIYNIFKDGEVNKKSNMQKMHIANSDKPVFSYSLDIILAVGYRTNSARAIAFRQWATRVLRDHILNGYTINRKRIARNYNSFMNAVESVRALLPPASQVDTSSILDLISVFADTWVSLGAYDRGSFSRGKITKKKVVLAASELVSGIAELKAALQKNGEASDLFALERKGGSLEGIVGSVMQTFDGKDLYPSIEEKAAHLLYFVVKNHPFADGNKRSGAFAFVWFLRRTGLLDIEKMTPSALTALTLLIAESNPKDKEKMTGLIKMLLSSV